MSGLVILKVFTFVLIESDWNLKAVKKEQQQKAMNVLIESDWNLKFFIWG